MEFFLPSVLILLLAAAVVFFVFPSLGPLTLAVVSMVLLTLGVYQHWTQFGVEYRMSTWQLGSLAYAPYLMVGGLLVAIIIYLGYLLPVSSSSSNSTASIIPMPTVANMPSANTSTNPITAGINRAINTVTNLVKKNNNNNRTLGFPPSQV
jgi:hypothetical protein